MAICVLPARAMAAASKSLTQNKHRMKRLSLAIALAAIAASATAADVAFTGSNDDVNAPVGALNIAGNWAGVVPQFSIRLDGVPVP
jgi:hypothetical protein